MFNMLSDKLQKAVRSIRGLAKISESNVDETLREVRRALLEADVNYKVVKDFIASVKSESFGQKVLDSITPGQQIVKIISDKLTDLLGSESKDIDTSAKETRIMVVGINGSGKTTTAAKLAHYLRTKRQRKPCLVACDLARPAAVEQLRVLGSQIGVPVYSAEGEKDPRNVCLDVLNGTFAESHDCDTLIFDTAGRLHINEELMEELDQLAKIVSPHEILLVADAMTGQDAVKIAQEFSKRIPLTGIILTKMDADARGGAALSLKTVAGCPLKMIGVGEKISELEQFHPDRMASRILGMGDIVSLVEKAQESVDVAEQERLSKKILTKKLDFEDFYKQLQSLKKMGSLQSVLSMVPGMSQLKGAVVDDGQLKQFEAMIQSMTPKERSNPDLLDMSRRRRIAKGSGTSLADVNAFIKQFNMMRKMMKRMGNMGKMFAKGLPF